MSNEMGKVTQIAMAAGFDGTDSCGSPLLCVLYENGEVWRCVVGEEMQPLEDGGWHRVVLPDERIRMDAAVRRRAAKNVE